MNLGTGDEGIGTETGTEGTGISTGTSGGPSTHGGTSDGGDGGRPEWDNNFGGDFDKDYQPPGRPL